MVAYLGQLPFVLVFRTNISSKKDLQRVATVLDGNPQIVRWNVDRKDVDKVLRIESETLRPAALIDLITRTGFYCEELPD